MRSIYCCLSTVFFVIMTCSDSLNSVNATTLSLGKYRYVVSEIVNLEGGELILPNKTQLIVEGGGGFVNGKVSGKNIKILSTDSIIFFSNVETCFENTELKSCWYENLLSCISSNINCTISIGAGIYFIQNKAYDKIRNSLYGRGGVYIKHIAPFSVGDDIIIDGINWDGMDKAAYWIYCQPNHLAIRNSSFQNYYGKSAGIICWSHSERDTEGLLIEDCSFGRVGAKENGVIGDMEGSSFVIYTYRCDNIIIRNNRFEGQFGLEDSDAIKLEGGKINMEKNFPVPSGDTFKYANIQAIIEGNIFVNVPKSPIKIFASGVEVRNNRMNYRDEVKTAIARVFRGANIIIKNNIAECSDVVSNAIEVHDCQNVRLENNGVIATCIEGKAFGEFLRIENCANVNVIDMDISLASSSLISPSQALVRLSGKNIIIKKSHFRAPYSYYGIYAPLGIDGLKVEKTTFEVEKGLQYAFLINNAVKNPQGTCTFSKCTFKLSADKIDDATSYGAAFAENISLKGCVFDYKKGITLDADRIEVAKSEMFGVNVQNCSNVTFADCILHGGYTPITVGTLKDGAKIKIEKLTADSVELALVRFKDKAPTSMSIGGIRCPGIVKNRLLCFDRADSFTKFQKQHNLKKMLERALR